MMVISNVSLNHTCCCIPPLSDVGRPGLQGGCEQQGGGGLGRQLKDHCPTTGTLSRLVCRLNEGNEGIMVLSFLLSLTGLWSTLAVLQFVF